MGTILMTEEENHDNDADKRPRMYARATSKFGQIEVTVQGGEGEKVEDLEDPFEEAVETMSDKQEEITEEQTTDRAIQ